MTSRVLVAGSSGFIGRALMGRLIGLSIDVGEIAGRSDCDMTDRRTLSRRLADIAPRVVVHLAASPDDGRALESGGLDGNTLSATENLLSVVAERSCKVIHVGSYKQYGDVDLPFRESSDVRPRSMYGASKQASESLVRRFAASGACVAACLRMGPVYGPGQLASQLLHRLASALTGEGDPVAVGARPWDPIYIDDAVEALVAAVLSPKVNGEVLNVSSGLWTTPLEVAQIMARELGVSSHTFDKRVRLVRSLGWDCGGDPSRMVASTGWTANVSLEDGIRRVLETRRTVPEGGDPDFTCTSGRT